MRDSLHLFSAAKQESAKAQAAYTIYEAMGPDRSLEKVAQKYGKSTAYVRQIERWSSSFNWVARALAYDREQEEAARRKRIEAIDKMDDEQATLSRMLLIRAVDALKRRLEKDDIGAYALVQLFDKAANLERMARGAATARSEVMGKDGGPIEVRQVPELAEATDEELDRLESTVVSLIERRQGRARSA